MSRPSITTIDATKSGWVADLNSNFTKLYDGPFPIYLVTSVASLTTDMAKLYKDCFAMVDEGAVSDPEENNRLYLSNGATWIAWRRLNYVADLAVSSVTIADIKTAFNALLTDLKSKKLMGSTASVRTGSLAETLGELALSATGTVAWVTEQWVASSTKDDDLDFDDTENWGD